MCINATVRAVLDLGYQITICDDVVAVQHANQQGISLDTPQVNTAFLSALSMAQARLVPSIRLVHKASVSNTSSHGLTCYVFLRTYKTLPTKYHLGKKFYSTYTKS